MTASARVLVADDEASIRFVLRRALEEAGHEVVDVDSGEAAWAALAEGRFAVAFLDIRMPGPSGLELLERLRATRSDVAVVVITAQNTLENAVEAMKRGALDYLVKPFQMAEVLAAVEKALRTRSLERELRTLRQEAGGAAGGERLVGRSHAILEVFKTIGRVAPRDVSVLITGESGTGKELVARAIHKFSPRREGPFIAVNCAALPEHLIQAELFGHEKGAFTGAHQRKIGRLEAAAGGTIFLDEIGDLPLALQVNLLHVLQEKVIERLGSSREIRLDVRVIAASHVELEQAVADGRFRADLFYRINVLRLNVPPLREREDDVQLLARAYFDKFRSESRGVVRDFGRQAMTVMANYEWPGNVRELINRVRQAVVLSDNRLLKPGDLGLEKRVSSDGFLTLEEARSRAEHDTIRRALRRNQNNVTAAARQLGVSRATLYRALERVAQAEGMSSIPAP